MGSFVVDSHSFEESLSAFIKANEEADEGTVFATRLSVGTVQAIPGLSIRFQNSQCLYERVDRLANRNNLVESEDQ